MDIHRQTPVLVSGGASGLGAACVRLFRAAEAPVTILDLDGDRGRAFADATGARFEPCDVTDEASVTEAIARAGSVQGPARIVVCCAGIAPASKTAGSQGAHPMDLFERVIAVNLTGSMRVAAHAAQAMRALPPLDADGCRGAIVLTASVAAWEGQVGQAAYAASKAGVAGLVLPMARDLARDGIRVCGIAPGLFETPMVAGLPEGVQESLAGQVPFPARLGDPMEFARLAAMLVETGYMNGAVVRLDGAIRMGAR